MPTVQDSWAKMEALLAKIAPDVISDLNEGAEDFLFSALEAKIGVDLPDEFVEFYKIHNGQNFEAVGGFIYCEQLLPITGVIDEWNIWKKLYDDKDFDDSQSSPAKGIKDDWWNPLWIPITSDGSGNNYCVDLDPAEGGKIGQVIRMWHDDAIRELVANSISEWFLQLIDEYAKGGYKYSDDAFGIIKEN